MVSMIQDLFRHKWWANANLLHAIGQHPAAAEDEELRKMLHHILFSNRFWLFAILVHPFVREDEMQIPADLAGVIERFKVTEHLESEWLSKATDTDLDRILQTRSSRLGIDVTVRQAILQICMHTQGHRAQCASRLRGLGGTPPSMDFVLWVKDQATPRQPVPRAPAIP
jgi:uncharacterized damage-inducible protein DinB